MAYSAKVIWKEGRHFEGISSGHSIEIDAPLPTGTDLGMNPMQLLLVSLGGCTGMDVVNILQKERINLQSLCVTVNAERAPELPTVYTEIELVFTLAGTGLTYAAVEHAVELSEEKYCSVGIMIGKTAKIKTRIEIENLENHGI
ncbi:MAG: OsmC family protein [Chloroflexota bacterium]